MSDKFHHEKVDEIICRSKPRLRLFQQEDFEKLKIESDNESEYESIYHEKDNVSERKLWIKKSGKGSAISGATNIRHKYCCKFPFSAKVFYDTMRDYARRHEWDNRDLGRSILQVYQVPGTVQNQVIENFVKAGTLMVANREFITLNAEQQLEGMIYMLGKSIDISETNVSDPSRFHPLNPVRSDIVYLGQAIIPISENVCQYWCITQVDPGGWIPSMLYNYATRYLPKEFQNTMSVGCRGRQERDNEYINFYN
ncbi:hypothetical protein AKO1_002214, partial [Acrasis kona]